MFESIPIGDLEAEWPSCLPHVRRAIDRSAGSVTAETVLEALRCGAFHLWRTRDGQNPVVAVKTITHHAEFDALLIVLIGGKGLPHWITAVEAAFGAALEDVQERIDREVDSLGKLNVVVAKSGKSKGLA